MQIHELDDFIGTIGSDTVLAIDDGTETTKVPATALIQDFAAVGVFQSNVSSLPVTITDEKIDAGLMAIGLNLQYPEAQTGYWTIFSILGILTLIGFVLCFYVKENIYTFDKIIDYDDENNDNNENDKDNDNDNDKDNKKDSTNEEKKDEEQTLH